MRGADSVNEGELEVGFDDRFERRFRWVAFAGRVFLALVVVAGLLGLLGRGPYSHARLQSPDGTLWIDYEPVARYGATTQVTFHILQPSKDGDPVRLWINSAFMEPMGLHQIAPQPATATADSGGQLLGFLATQGRPALVRLQLKPDAVGPITLAARLGNGATLHWSQWILP